MGQSRPLFVLFLSFSRHNFNNTIAKKCRWCAWDVNLGTKDGRHGQNHGAMALGYVGFNFNLLLVN